MFINNETFETQIMHLILPFNINPDISDDARETIVAYIQGLYAHRAISFPLDGADILEKKKYMAKVGYYIDDTDRWPAWVGRARVDSTFKLDWYGQVLDRAFHDVDNLELRNAYSAFKKQLPFTEAYIKEDKDFSDVVLALNEIQTSSKTVDDFLLDMKILRFLVYNEIVRRSGEPYVQASEYLSAIEEYFDTMDLDIIKSLNFLPGINPDMAATDVLLRRMGWSIIAH